MDDPIGVGDCANAVTGGAELLAPASCSPLAFDRGYCNGYARVGRPAQELAGVE